jgi:hypothetical protein
VKQLQTQDNQAVNRSRRSRAFLNHSFFGGGPVTATVIGLRHKNETIPDFTCEYAMDDNLCPVVFNFDY